MRNIIKFIFQRKPKYKIGDCLYFFNGKTKRIEVFRVEEIIIRPIEIVYSDSLGHEEREEYLQPSVKKLAKKVLGKEFTYARALEKITEKGEEK